MFQADGLYAYSTIIHTSSRWYSVPDDLHASHLVPAAVSADELLPLLVYLVLTTEISNWYVFYLLSFSLHRLIFRRSNLAYIQDFHFSQVGSEEFL